MSNAPFQVEVDLVSDWVQLLSDELQAEGYNLRSSLSPDEICKQYFDTRRRVPASRPRTVHRSREFQWPSDTKLHAGIKAIEQRAKGGQDLTPYLHDKILNPESRDGLLDDWSIHHFHLGTKPWPKDPRFMCRTDKLLFALVTAQDFYMIDVLGHKVNDEPVWAKKHLLEVLHTNWPDKVQHLQMTGIGGSGFTEEHHRMFRNKGVLALVELDDGTVYAPIGGGIHTGRGSVATRRACDIHFWALKNLSRHLKLYPEELATYVHSWGGKLGKQLQLHLKSFELSDTRGGVAILKEENSGEVIPWDFKIR